MKQFASKDLMSDNTTTRRLRGFLRSIGLGLVSGAADDDCSAIGTYTQAGAQLGYRALWTAPVAFPMMVAVVYLSAKLGLVTGQGLFATLRSHFPRGLLYPLLVLVIVGNIIEAGADIGGMAASLGILVHVSQWVLVLGVTMAASVLQLWGSYRIIRNVFRILALTLFAYIVSAFRSHPELGNVVHGTLVPTVHFDQQTLAILVAIVGASLSTYLCVWQSNQEVEEKEAGGKHTPRQRRGTTDEELKASLLGTITGMLISSAVMYSIILTAATTLYVARNHTIATALQAAESLKPLAGRAAGLIFTVGIVGTGFLAVPIMVAGAAYALSQTFGWENGLYHGLGNAKRFYAAISVFMLLAMGMNFIGINPMRALVIAGIMQGLSIPPIMLLIMIMTNNRSIMGDKVNGKLINALGWVTTTVIFAASGCLLFSWLHS